MKNLLILIVFAAVYLHFFPEPELDAWIAEKKEAAISGFNNATDTNVKLNPRKIYQDLQAQFENFSDEEIDYIGELTTKSSTVVSYYFENCEPYKQDFKFQSKNQRKVCKTISKYRKFF
jgi:hypothetical protein